jgi:hypothetical protein
MTCLPNTEHRLCARFLYLAGIELLLAGAWTFVIALSQNLRTTTLLAVAVMIIGLVCFAMPIFLKKYSTNIVSVLGSGFGQVAALVIPILLSAFFYLRNPSIDALKIIGPVLVSLWLIGIEALFFFQEPKEVKTESSTSNRLAFLAILFCYGILLIPSRVPSLLDGLPWNTPLEFITATLILPFAFFFGRSFLSQKTVTLLLALLIAAKLTLSFFLPQSGLGIHAYFSEETRASRIHEPTYESFLDPVYSQVMRIPYRTFFDFPIESINSHGFDKDSFWMAVEFNGAISLKEDERLVVLLQGAVERKIELVDLVTGESFFVETAKSADDLDAEFFTHLPQVGDAELKGYLVYPNYGNGKFEPVILGSDGSVASALPRMWLSPSALGFPAQGFQFLQTLIALIMFGVVLFSLFDGIRFAYRTGDIDFTDFYLALSGLILFYIVGTADKPGIDRFIQIIVFAFALIKMLNYLLQDQVYSGTGYLFGVGLPVLLMLLPLDLRSLTAVTTIPQYQDAMEYQMLARNIYVHGDAFLLQSPPWAYKVLFPYVIGLLHVLFGQSLSAQFFLNGWCALLSVVFMIKVGGFFGLTKRFAFVAASVFLILTFLPLSFTYFFRFGLIEPVAILTLLITAYFAKEGRFGSMFFMGVVTGMLRLNFAGAVFTSITFLAPACVGGLTQAWGSFINWLRLSWRRVLGFLIAIPFPSLLIAFIYSRFHPGYTLTHEMNDQSSLASVLESLASVIVGSDREYFAFQIRAHPLDLILIALPILSSLLIALASLVYRKGLLEKLDLRLSLFLLSMLPVYAILKPIGYFPRYSWSFLPPALIILGLVLQFAIVRDNTKQ